MLAATLRGLDGALLVVGARRGARLIPHARSLVDDPAPAGLPFVPEHHVAWSSTTGALVAAAWTAGGARSDARSGGPFGCLLGRARVPGADGGDAAVAALVAQAVRSGPPLDRVDGMHVGAALGADGAGAVWADPAGRTVLYLAEGETSVAVSTRPDLAAAAVEGPAARRDPMAAAWLVAARYGVGARTGFASVRVLAPAEWVRLRAGEAPAPVAGTPPWKAAADLRAEPPAELVGAIREGLARDLRSLLEWSPEHPVVDLTGGRDSRMLLAVALSEGLEGSFRFRTLGGPALPDVVVASELAAAYGLEHVVEFPLPTDQTTWLRRATTFTSLTAGSINLWEECRRAGPRLLRVSGFPGEVVRGYYRPRPVPTTADEVRRSLHRTITGDALLLPPVAAALRAELDAEIDACLADVWDPASALDVFALRNTLRFRFGMLHDVEPGERLAPFYAPEVLRAAHAVPAAERMTEVIAYALIAGWSPALASHRFSGAGWDVAALAPLLARYGAPPLPPPPDRPAAPTEPPSPVAPAAPTGGAAAPPAVSPSPGPPPSGPPPGAKAASLVGTFKANVRDDRFADMADLLASDDHPLWEVADRAAVRGALAGVTELTKQQQQQVYAAVTGALWLAPDGSGSAPG